MKYLLFFTLMFCMSRTVNSQAVYTANKPTKTKQHFSQVVLSDSTLLSVINKYDKYLHFDDQEVFVLIQERKDNEYIYYITGIINMSQLIKNWPSSYTIINKEIFLIYNGLEKVIQPNAEMVNHLKILLKPLLRNDLLPDGKTIDPNKVPPNYDPIQLKIVIKDGRVISEDLEKGFGLGGRVPYFN